MNAKPKLSDLPAVHAVYQAGDRILVRTPFFLNLDQVKNVTRSVKKFAGADVSVLVVNQSEVGIRWLQKNGSACTLVSRTFGGSAGVPIANLDCSKVDLSAGDILIVLGMAANGLQYVREWAGKDVEVVCVPYAEGIKR